MRLNASVRIALFATVIAFGIAPRAEAGLLPVAVGATAEGGATRYTYGIVLTSDSMIQPGDYFTVYDFAGFVGGSAAGPLGFTFSSSKVGETPAQLAPHDNAMIPNLTWVYTGTAPILGQVAVGNFSALSTLTGTTEGDFTAQTHRQIDGVIDGNLTETHVPVPGVPNVPEPATLALAALGLPIFAASRYFRKGRKPE